MAILIIFRMAFKAKNGHKWKHQWAWPLFQSSMKVLGLVAWRIFANFTILGFQASQGKEFYRKLDIPEDLKYIFIFAQWVWGPKLVLYRWVLLKLHYLIMNLHYFLGIF